MPEFANPQSLLLLPIVPLLLYWWLRRRRAALRFADIRAFAGLSRGRVRRVHAVGAILRSLVVLLVILAMAGPRRPDLKTRVPTESIAIMIVLDTSGSMEQQSFIWQPGSAPISRREAAQRAFRLFVAGGDAPDGTHFDGRSTERGTDAIGLVLFAKVPHPVCPPILNHSVLLHILDHYRQGTVRDDGSNVGDAIAEGLFRLETAAPKRKVLILLSDCEHNFDHADPDRRPLKPRQAAQMAGQLRIPIYVIDPSGELPTDAKPNERQQRDEGRRIAEAIAELTKGRVFNANDGHELLNVCKTIDGLERQPVLSHAYRRYHEYYPWLTGLALVLAIAITFFEQTRWRRIP